MKIMKRMMSLAAAILALSACSESEDLLSAFHSDPNAVRITAEIGKASADGFTRSNPLGATEADQKKFNENDEISVQADGQDAVTYKLVGSEWQPQDGKFLKWESNEMNFTAYYPASYTGGTPTQPTEYTTVESLAAADYMSFTGSQKNDGNNTLSLTMERKMARVAVDIAGFNDQYASGTEVKSVTINGVKAFKQEKQDNQNDKFYALMVPCKADNNAKFLSLEVGQGNTETLTGIPVLEAGKSYTYQITVGKNKVVVTGITVKDWTTGETFEGKATPTPYVTFTAEGEQTFKLVKNGYFPSNIEYSVNEGEWNILKETDEILFGGDKGKLQLRGTNNLNGTSADNNYSTINFTDASVKVACTGDIRTLLDYKTYKTVETKEARFCKLFSGCTELTSAPDLPATTLAESCYYYMFRGCTNLDTAPALPAETLANSCYDSMFLGCTNLKTAPALPAETLVDYCYYYMFNGCKNLKTAPVLPATALANSCYYNMFSGCTNLKTAPKLPATTLANSCYSCMFKDCKNLNTAPELQATTLASYCYYRMFGGCTNLKTAPELPATTLASLCYANMFNGCTNLTSVTMLAPSDQISKTTYCCRDWLNGAGTNATARTLKVKDEAAYNALVDKSYLPNNWKKDAASTTVLGENSNKIE